MAEHAEKKVEYDYIDDGIYIGTNFCCQVHFDKGLKSEGVEADISLEGEQVDSPFGVKSYVWLPVADKTAPTLDQLDIGVDALEKLVSMSKKVYVHCKNGHGRAPTLVAAYFMNKGMSVEEAVAHIKAKRPSIHLQDVQIAKLQEYKGKTQVA
jgi:protein tyrosine phosphatase (PTP) superfamily phosphohydrolase (DUF442 family)